jgi:hypothetical protein
LSLRRWAALGIPLNRESVTSIWSVAAMSLRKVFSTILASDTRGVGAVGDSATIRCPAHDDETPSLSVTLAGDKLLQDVRGVL